MWYACGECGAVFCSVQACTAHQWWHTRAAADRERRRLEAWRASMEPYWQRLADEREAERLEKERMRVMRRQKRRPHVRMKDGAAFRRIPVRG